MENAIILAGAAPTPGGALVSDVDQLDQNAAAVCLASLAPGSRPAMQGALNTLARLLGAPRVCNDAGLGKPTEITCLFVNWAALRFQHTAALRAKLAETYKARTANKMLSALRGTLKAAWRLEQMDAETYRRAIDLERIGKEKDALQNTLAEIDAALDQREIKEADIQIIRATARKIRAKLQGKPTYEEKRALFAAIDLQIELRHNENNEKERELFVTCALVSDGESLPLRGRLNSTADSCFYGGNFPSSKRWNIGSTF